MKINNGLFHFALVPVLLAIGLCTVDASIRTAISKDSKAEDSIDFNEDSSKYLDTSGFPNVDISLNVDVDVSKKYKKELDIILKELDRYTYQEYQSPIFDSRLSVKLHFQEIVQTSHFSPDIKTSEIINSSSADDKNVISIGETNEHEVEREEDGSQLINENKIIFREHSKKGVFVLSNSIWNEQDYQKQLEQLLQNKKVHFFFFNIENSKNNANTVTDNDDDDDHNNDHNFDDYENDKFFLNSTKKNDEVKVQTGDDKNCETVKAICESATNCKFYSITNWNEFVSVVNIFIFESLDIKKELCSEWSQWSQCEGGIISGIQLRRRTVLPVNSISASYIKRKVQRNNYVSSNKICETDELFQVADCVPNASDEMIIEEIETYNDNIDENLLDSLYSLLEETREFPMKSPSNLYDYNSEYNNRRTNLPTSRNIKPRWSQQEKNIDEGILEMERAMLYKKQMRNSLLGNTNNTDDAYNNNNKGRFKRALDERTPVNYGSELRSSDGATTESRSATVQRNKYGDKTAGAKRNLEDLEKNIDYINFYSNPNIKIINDENFSKKSKKALEDIRKQRFLMTQHKNYKDYFLNLKSLFKQNSIAYSYYINYSPYVDQLVQFCERALKRCDEADNFVIESEEMQKIIDDPSMSADKKYNSQYRLKNAQEGITHFYKISSTNEQHCDVYIQGMHSNLMYVLELNKTYNKQSWDDYVKQSIQSSHKLLDETSANMKLGKEDIVALTKDSEYTKKVNGVLTKLQEQGLTEKAEEVKTNIQQLQQTYQKHAELKEAIANDTQLLELKKNIDVDTTTISVLADNAMKVAEISERIRKNAKLVEQLTERIKEQEENIPELAEITKLFQPGHNAKIKEEIEEAVDKSVKLAKEAEQIQNNGKQKQSKAKEIEAIFQTIGEGTTTDEKKNQVVTDIEKIVEATSVDLPAGLKQIHKEKQAIEKVHEEILAKKAPEIKSFKTITDTEANEALNYSRFIDAKRNDIMPHVTNMESQVENMKNKFKEITTLMDSVETVQEEIVEIQKKKNKNKKRKKSNKTCTNQ